MAFAMPEIFLNDPITLDQFTLAEGNRQQPN